MKEKENVYFIKIQDKEDDRNISRRLKRAIEEKNLFSFISAKDLVAVKTHFGEEGAIGYARPIYFSMLGEMIKQKEAVPFLTETQTLYSGRRTNAPQHMELAYEHGFTYEDTGLPIVMADGLLGDEEIEVEIPGKIYQKVKIAALVVKTQAMVMVSHFTGHLVSGFGAALKNMGMGCASRRGKLIQHSTAKPSIKKSKCTGCGECVKWCPAGAITLVDGKAEIKNNLCIGCAECLAVCRFDAVGYNWSETYVHLQEKMVEHAMGVAAVKKDKILYINFLNRITKDCDCMTSTGFIVPDVGVLLSYDPVAIDAASLDLVEEKAGTPLTTLAYDIPHRVQIDYARELGFGNPDYNLVEI